MTLLNRIACISIRVLSRALNNPGGIPSSPAAGALFTFSLSSTSSTSVTDIPYQGLVHMPLRHLVAHSVHYFFSYLGFGNATAALWDLRPFQYVYLSPSGG